MQVSVSITTYNHERFIAQALDGVLMQRVDFPYEIIVGDDCSTDGTSAIVDDIQRAHPELIRVIRPAANLGDNGKPMFMETLKAARGRYIAMLDGDDYWIEDHKLAAQFALMEGDADCVMTYHNAIKVFDDGTGPENYNPPGHVGILTTEKLLERNCVPSCSAMIRAELVAQPPPPWFEAAPWADWPLWLLATERGTVKYIDQVLGAYRIHRQGAWSGLNPVDQAAQLVAFFEMLYPYFSAGHALKLDEMLYFTRELLTKARLQLPVADGDRSTPR